jgi:hypothetical protein
MSRESHPTPGLLTGPTGKPAAVSVCASSRRRDYTCRRRCGHSAPFAHKAAWPRRRRSRHSSFGHGSWTVVGEGTKPRRERLSLTSFFSSGGVASDPIPRSSAGRSGLRGSATYWSEGEARARNFQSRASPPRPASRQCNVSTPGPNLSDRERPEPKSSSLSGVVRSCPRMAKPRPGSTSWGHWFEPSTAHFEKSAAEAAFISWLRSVVRSRTACGNEMARWPAMNARVEPASFSGQGPPARAGHPSLRLYLALEACGKEQGCH